MVKLWSRTVLFVVRLKVCEKINRRVEAHQRRTEGGGLCGARVIVFAADVRSRASGCALKQRVQICEGEIAVARDRCELTADALKVVSPAQV